MKAIASEIGVVCGAGLIASSMAYMLTVHEYAISSFAFIAGILLFGIAYATLPTDKRVPINTDKINQNLQALNDTLWGDRTSETYWRNHIQCNCRDLRERCRVLRNDLNWEGYYCFYGATRGYCTYKNCPRGPK